jgi:hypothetical protein
VSWDLPAGRAGRRRVYGVRGRDRAIDVIGEPTRVPRPDAPRAELGYRDALPTQLVFASGHRVVEKPRERRYIGAR